MMRLSALLIVFFSILAFGIYITPVLYTNLIATSYIDDGGIVYDDAVSYWQEAIRELGGTKAYAMMLAEGRKLDTSQHHTLAHSFGDALFDIMGRSGVVVCDQSFASGCIHELLGVYFDESGVHNLEEVRSICAGRLACNHGVGHGLTAYFGYSEQDLHEAITGCKLYGDSNYRGCLGGVFMEYNTRTVLDNNAGGVREIKQDQLFSPCPSLDGVARNACFTWQIQLISNTLYKNSQGVGKIKQIVDLCSTLQANSDRTYCLYGIGNSTWPDVEWNVKEMMRACKHTTTYDDFAACIKGGIVPFLGGTQDLESSKTLCETLKPVDAKGCRQTISEFYN